MKSDNSAGALAAQAGTPINKRFARIALLPGLMALPLMAVAHPDHAHDSHTADFVSGFLHPLTGIDHLLVMLAVGTLSALAAGRTWQPSLRAGGGFLGMLALGMWLGWAGDIRQWIEIAVVGSLGLLAIPLLMRRPPSLRTISSAGGLVALFHGLSHGRAWAADAHPVMQMTGALLASAVLLAIGIGIGRGIHRFRTGRMPGRSLQRTTAGITR